MDEMHETVTIDGSVGKLVGDIDRPAVSGKECPVIVFYHGLTGNRSEDHIIAVRDSLLAHGIAVVRFDFNGHGESEGLFSAMTLANEVEDAKLILDYVYSLDWVNRDKVGIAGHSQGGFVAGVVAGDLGVEKVKCAVLMAPAACIHRYCVEGRFDEDGPEIDLETMPDSILFWGGRFLGKQYVLSGIDIDAHGRASHYDGPACIIQGSEDSPGLLKDAKKYTEYIQDCEYVELEGLTHCYMEDCATPARAAADFVVRKFGL